MRASRPRPERLEHMKRRRSLHSITRSDDVHAVSDGKARATKEWHPRLPRQASKFDLFTGAFHSAPAEARRSVATATL
jgi:hypothetical protein